MPGTVIHGWWERDMLAVPDLEGAVQVQMRVLSRGKRERRLDYA
jgi:hypothetical protein